MNQIWLILSLILAITHSVESSSCEWIGGASGSQISCLPGWFPTGLCGSGRRASCKDGLTGSKYIYQIKCCNLKATTEPSTIYQVTSAGGVDATCDKYSNGTIDPMIGGCGSGQKNACKLDSTKYTNLLTCGITSSLTFGPVSSCSWRYENEGEQQTCPSGYYLTGACGSNQYPNCANGSAMTGIYCCPLI